MGWRIDLNISEMSYVVYVNNPNSITKVHKTTCIHYINRKSDITHCGYWTESFGDFDEAMVFAKNVGKARVDSCAFCIKI